MAALLVASTFVGEKGGEKTFYRGKTLKSHRCDHFVQENGHYFLVSSNLGKPGGQDIFFWGGDLPSSATTGPGTFLLSVFSKLLSSSLV